MTSSAHPPLIPRRRFRDSPALDRPLISGKGRRYRLPSSPIVRYPGGNFVSGYDWRDGVGPNSARPRVLDRAWNSLETNQFGTNEFVAWCRAVGAEPLLATNFGTAGAEMSAALVEYCNVERGTRWSELRRAHGIEKPHGVKYWCLGNEMDGTWQIGHMTATEYGMKAADAARQMRTVDPTVKLVACGSSASGMPTYLEWDRQTLEACYEWVDAISLHRYFGLGDPQVQDDARGQVLDLQVETDGYEVKGLGNVPYLDVAGTFDSQKGESCLLVLNRDLAKARELELVWREAAPARVVRAEVLTGDDLRAVNSFAQPQRVSPRPLEPPKPGPKMVVELPPRSYSVLVLAAS